MDKRQQLYLRALETIPNLTIHYGFYLKSKVSMPKAKSPHKAVTVIKREEKGSDVNLSSFLLLDAFNNDFDQAIVVSNDSDLATPLWMLKRKLHLVAGVWNPQTQGTCDRKFHSRPHVVGAAPPKVRPSFELRKVLSFRQNYIGRTDK